MPLLDSSTPVFHTTVSILFSLLSLAVVIGLVYHSWYKRLQKRRYQLQGVSCPSIHPSIHPFARSLVRLFIRSFVPSLFTHPCIPHPSVRLSIHQSIELTLSKRMPSFQRPLTQRTYFTLSFSFTEIRRRERREYTKTKLELQQMVEEFYQRFSLMYEQMRLKHRKQLERLKIKETKSLIDEMVNGQVPTHSLNGTWV